MSETKNVILKWGSYIFMGFLVILITISFGMPNFISTSATADRFISAYVGDQVITRRELVRVKNNYIRNRFGGQNLPEMQQKFLESSILEQLIFNRIMLIFAREYGFYPGAKARKRIVAKFLKKNHADYLVGSKFDFERFQREFLQPNQLTLSEYESILAQEKTLTRLDSTLRSEAPVSDYQILAELQKKETVYSVMVLAITPQKKNELLEKKVRVTPAEIYDRFKKDYLSKDKKAKLNKTKREAIEALLKNEKRPKVEKEWMDSLNQFAQAGNIASLQFAAGTQFVTIQDINLSESLNSKKPPTAPDLSSLESDDSFLANVFSNNTQTIFGPLRKNGNIFFYKIISFKKSDLPLAADLKKSGKKIEELLPGRKQDIESIRSQLADKIKAEAEQNMFELMRKEVKIVRIKQEAS
ncbi:MAG: hypothetical protein D6767_01445 [Candidatus Hydrogenedentota bacterium]|nr:MAG: hypothetical protein D6767_01445 [Candidatus Hydrogenedentota bacterium]